MTRLYGARATSALPDAGFATNVALARRCRAAKVRSRVVAMPQSPWIVRLACHDLFVIYPECVVMWVNKYIRNALQHLVNTVFMG